MDPNANLREQEVLLARYTVADRRRLRELRKALATWLTNGGFDPQWAEYPHAARYFKQLRLYVDAGR